MHVLPKGQSPSQELSDLAAGVQFSAIRGSLTATTAVGTLHAMGVRFVVRSAEGQAFSDELAYGFDQARIVIGRGPGADVRIPHLTVSEAHATVHLDGDGYAIVDNDSTNGTHVNGARLSPGRKKRLHDADLIEIGAYTLTVHTAVALAETVTAERTAELARRLFRHSHAGAHLGAPRLCVLTGGETGKSLPVPKPPSRLLIGRGESCQLRLADPEVASEHAEIVRDLDGVLIRKLERAARLEINGQALLQKRLRDGDELALGQSRLLFEDPAEEPIDTLAAEADRTLPPPAAPRPPPEPNAPALDRPPEQPAHSSEPPRARRSQPSLDADVIIYTLAAIVIAVSIAGLIALMSAY
jgi:pSer/pThr/pTyr-binding forkhead associated (FHA) protein